MLSIILEFSEDYLFIPFFYKCANLLGNCIVEYLVKSCGTQKKVSKSDAASEEIGFK